MAQCSNCKKNLSCGCQKKKASDGTSVCASCITSYEAQTNKNKSVKSAVKGHIPVNSKKYQTLNKFIK